MSYVVYETHVPDRWLHRAYVPPFRSRWPRYRLRRWWPYAGFGETKTWLGAWRSKDEVYLWRARLRGMPMKHPDQALTIVRAVGRAVAKWDPVQGAAELDVRGVALSKIADTDWSVDVVMTAVSSGPDLLVKNAQGIANDAMAEPELRQLFPQLSIEEPQLLQLTGPPGAVDHWRAQPLLWDHNLGPEGGPTDTFAKPAEYSIVLGTADEGKLAKPWTSSKPGLTPPPPKGGGTNGSGQDTILAAGIVLVGVVAVAKILGSNRRRKGART